MKKVTFYPRPVSQIDTEGALQAEGLALAKVMRWSHAWSVRGTARGPALLEQARQGNDEGQRNKKWALKAKKSI